jgi:hypothetical protein
MNNAIVKARLEAIARNNGGVLRPFDVVQDARQPDSPLHELFEWDVEEAAQEHWMHTARRIIASVKVNITTETIVLKAPAYVRDPRLHGREQGYLETIKLRTEHEIAKEVLAGEVQNVISALRRARNVAAALEMEDEIDRLMEEFLEMRMKLKNAA